MELIVESNTAISYGIGNIGRDVARFMAEKGVVISGAVDVKNVGKDLGDVIGVGRKLNVEISDNADEVLANTGADIALISIATSMDTIYPHAKKCLEAGLNVITTSEEASYPWTTSPGIAAQIDKIAKENGVTFTGSGMQDVFWANLITTLTGASHRIESVEGRTSINMDELGPMVAEFYAVGRKADEINKMIEKGEKLPLGDEVVCLRMDLENQISDLGLTPKSFREIVTPIILKKDLKCRAFDKTIPAGDVTGLDNTIEIETWEGILFRATQTAKVYEPGEQDVNEWVIKGEPTIHLRNDSPPTLLGTSSQIVNRIPDVINAEPGYVTIDQLPKLVCKVRSLEHYLK
jgi:4-hydroxy-tetrahydrodipicolinate reductase